MAELTVARSELILGGQKSGKTARAESLAASWLAASPAHEAVYIATAQGWDDEMRERIARHRLDRAVRVPRMRTVEEPTALAHAIGAHSDPKTLVVVDCLTLWLTARLMPSVDTRLSGGGEVPRHSRERGLSRPSREGGDDGPGGDDGRGDTELAAAIAACAGPLVLISNEIGLGIIPMGRDVRAFVDSLGQLNQAAAAACERVTLMSAGLPMRLKGQP